ncbi:MAG: hypothetical protein A3E80_00270 [Chlamydiae bacterium RIFCSPHIGHO2_12_FULL_49_9]|nr:MAG: hypothetical protein A3E80_00270 [Chlamydiae bacterium RIFCSPHIGHO2_12_FULL_49_9]
MNFIGEYADTIRSFLSIFMSLCAFLIFIPKGHDYLKKWQKSGKSVEFSAFIMFFVGAFFFLSANYIVFLKIISKWQI